MTSVVKPKLEHWPFYLGLLFFQCHVSAQEPEYESICHDANAEQAVDVQQYVEIGGILQWVTIKGSKCSNPVVLNVHGGPGNPVSHIAPQIYKDWEEDFTVVNWDQRGSGKTYQVNHPLKAEMNREELMAEQENFALNLALIVEDGLQLTNHLKKVLNKDKLIVTGTSWGSVPGITMAAAAPASFYFYVGGSQLVNYHENTAASYQKVLARARQYEDSQALATLADIGAPPWTDPRSFGRLRRIIFAYEARVTKELIDEDIDPLLIPAIYQSEEARLAMLNGESFSFIKYVGMEGNGMARDIAFDRELTHFEIPVFFVQGKEDLLLVPAVMEKYFASISAPEKDYTELEQTGHGINWPLLDKLLDYLRSGMAKITSP